MAFPTLDLDAGRALALPSAPELRYRHCFIELGDGSEHLPDQTGRWRILDERLRTIGSYQLDAPLREHRIADLLHHEIAGEPARCLDDDGPDAVRLDPLQHRREAGPSVDSVCAAHGSVVE